VPPALGLITGRLVVSRGCHFGFTVSGERSAGLAIVVAELVRDYGIACYPVLLLAGLIQPQASSLGQVFRAMSPAVIYGMLAGIGVLILHPSFTS